MSAERLFKANIDVVGIRRFSVWTHCCWTAKYLVIGFMFFNIIIQG